MDKIKELVIYAIIILGLVYLGAYVQKNGVVINSKNVGGLLNNNECNTGSILNTNQTTNEN